MTAHQTKALVLSLLLHALFLSCALVFAGNAAPLKPPVRIELAIGTAGSGGAGPRTAAAPVQEKVEPAAPRPRQVVKTKPVRKKTPVRPQQVAAVRKPAPAVQPTRSTVPVPAPPSDPQPVAESVPQAVSTETAAPLTPRTLTIGAEGRIWVEADEVSLATLADALAATGRETPLVVRADRNLPLQQFVDVYEAVRGLGFTTLSLQTEQRP